MKNFQLAVNTSQSQAQILFLDGENFLSMSSWDKDRSHSEVITAKYSAALQKMGLKKQDLNKIYCVVGPGSFTGVRVGVGFCKALAYSVGCPIAEINSLDLVASTVLPQDRKIISCIDAQKNSIFYSAYHYDSGKLFRDEGSRLISIQDLPQLTHDKFYLAGEGLNRYIKFVDSNFLGLAITDEKWKTPNLKTFFSSPFYRFISKKKSWSEVKPLYIKASAPEEKLNPTK